MLLKIADMVSLMISSGITLTELKFDFRKERELNSYNEETAEVATVDIVN